MNGLAKELKDKNEMVNDLKVAIFIEFMRDIS